MGEYVRERVLRALGLSRVWVELSALSARMRRLEQDVRLLRADAEARQPFDRPRTIHRPRTIPASPPPPVAFDPNKPKGTA